MDRECLAVFETEHQTPYFWNLHYQDVGHALIQGATGSGKSFLAPFIVTHAQKYDPITVIFDHGGSYDARSIQSAQQNLDTLWNALSQPDAWSILANLLYWTMLLVIGLAQFALLFVVSFSLIASAICALVGPLFVPFFIVPSLERIFWGWLRAFIQYSFMRVIANAFIFLFERFLSGFLQTLPPGLRLEDQLLYSVHVVMILVTFTVGVLLVPSLTSSIFSGRSGESTLPDRIGF